MKKQNINIGDKLLCKDNLYEIFKKYKYYYVEYIEDNVTGSIHNLIYYTKDNNNVTYPIIDEHFFHSHFYTKKEERNMKLTKLNE